jgi:hypothetical protein
MAYRLREGLHWCACGGRVVFLDLLNDRYSCLPARAGAAFLRLARGRESRRDFECLKSLVDLGVLIQHGGAAAAIPSCPVEPASGDFSDPCGPARAQEIALAVISQWRWQHRLRSKGLAAAVSAVQRGDSKPCLMPDPRAEVRAMIAGFSAASLLQPAADRCLVRALAMQARCSAYGIRPLLVFGVRMDPFRAHCWVQLGAEVLIGEFEQVRLFTPILAVG